MLTDHNRMTVVMICHPRHQRDAAQRLVMRWPNARAFAFILVETAEMDEGDERDTDDPLNDATSEPSPMTVQCVTDRAELKPGHAYRLFVSQAGELSNGTLRLRPDAENQTPVERIGHLLRSLAQHHGDAGICVLLEGVSIDVQTALRRLREAGGIVIVQREAGRGDPTLGDDGRTGTPSSDVEQIASHILPLDEIPAIVVQAEDVSSEPPQAASWRPLVETDGPLRDVEQKLARLNEALEQRIAEQTRRVMLLHDVAMAANETTSVREMMQFTADRLCEALSCAAVHFYIPSPHSAGTLVPSRIWRIGDERFEPLRQLTMATTFARGQGAVGQVYATGKPQWLNDSTADVRVQQLAEQDRPPLGVMLLAPVLLRKQIAGVLEVFTTEPLEYDERVLSLLVNIGTHLGRVIERKRWEKEFADAVVEQQRMFGQELHDGVGQELTGLGYLARSLHRRLNELNLPEARSAGQLVSGIQSALVHVRAMSRGMFPVELDDNGLMSALSELAGTIERQYGIQCRFECDAPVPVYDHSVAIHLFRIAQEAINNAVKHGQAKHVVVHLSVDEDQIALSVTNDGRAFHQSPATGQDRGIGLRTMRYRASIIGATFQIHSCEDGNVTVTCTLKQEEIGAAVH